MNWLQSSKSAKGFLAFGLECGLTNTTATHAAHRPERGVYAAEQIKIRPCERTAREDADVERGLVANEFERAVHEETRVFRQFPLPRRIGMADDLVRVGRAAIDHGAIAVGFKLLARRVLGGAQRGKKLLFVPRSEQNVIAPLCIRVFDAVCGELRPLLDSRRAGP